MSRKCDDKVKVHDDNGYSSMIVLTLAITYFINDLLRCYHVYKLGKILSV